MVEVLMRILLTNDDGFFSEGIRELREYLLKYNNEVFVVTTDRNRSSSSHSLTLHRPLRLRKVEENIYAIDGTPADSVLMAIRYLYKDNLPDLVISGVNDGANLGEDVIYSGTVAAAFEARLLGIKSFAVSLACIDEDQKYFESAFFYTEKLIGLVNTLNLPNSTILNVNVPNKKLEDIKGIAFTKQGSRIYQENIIRRQDPRKNSYFWIGGHLIKTNDSKSTDFWALENNYVSITPIKADLTDYILLENLTSNYQNF